VRKKTVRCLLSSGVLGCAFLLPISRGLAQETASTAARVRLVEERQRPSTIDGLVVVGDVLVLRNGDAFYGLDSLSLRQRWILRGEYFSAGPFRVGENLFVVSDGSLLQIDPLTGIILRREAASGKPHLILGCANPGVLREVFQFLSRTEVFLGAVDLTRAIRSLEREKLDWKVSWLSARYLLVGAETGLVGFDLENPARVWRSAISDKIRHIQGCDGTLLVETQGGELVGIDESTGNVAWRFRIDGGRVVVDPKTSAVMVVSSKGPIDLVDPRSGVRRYLTVLSPQPGRIHDAWYFGALLAVEDASQRRLRFYDLKTGGLAWLDEVGGVISHVAVLDGYSCLSTEAGKLQIFGVLKNDSAEVGGSGSIDFHIDPEGALIWIDGFLKETGGRVNGLTVGSHRVRVFHPDREIYETSVDVRDGAISEVNIALDTIREGGLSITTNPDGANIYVDGKNTRLVTPYTLYNIAPAQILTVDLKKLGYNSVQRKVEMRKEGAEVSEKLEFSPGSFDILAHVAAGEFGSIKGWNEDDIRVGGVVGQPVKSRAEDGDPTVELRAEDWALRRMALWARYEVGGSGGYEREGGIWVSRDALRKLLIGLSYLYLYPPDSASTPPDVGQGGEDRSAPLENWDHPIPRVFVNNKGRDYLVARVRARLQEDLLLEVAVGHLLGASLRGTALVKGPDGHLVRDPERTYDFHSRDGNLIDISLRKGLGAFRFFRIFPSTTLELRYRYRENDFGVAQERGGEAALGLGLGLGK